MALRGAFHPESPPMTVWGSTANVIASGSLTVIGLIVGLNGELGAFGLFAVGALMTLGVFVPIMIAAYRRRARGKTE
jgi:hypothetical protein